MAVELSPRDLILQLINAEQFCQLILHISSSLYSVIDNSACKKGILPVKISSSKSQKFTSGDQHILE